MNAYWGSEGIALRILGLGTIYSSVVSFTSRLLYSSGKRPQHPLYRGRDGPQNRCRHGGYYLELNPGRSYSRFVILLTDLPPLL